MYNNAAGKLLSFIKLITGIMMCLFVLSGLVLGGTLESPILGILVAVIGCVFAWLSNLVIATFAQIGVDLHTLVSKQEVINAGQYVVEGESKRVQPPKAKWICGSCGQANLEGVEICQACGVTRAWSEGRTKKKPDTPKSATCPQCNAALQSGDAFCTLCGTKIAR